jgi:Transcriptional regulators
MFLNSFSIVVRYSKIFAERKLSQYEIGFSEQIILMYLAANDRINQDNIARYFMLDKGAIAKTLNKLEKKGFILKITNKKNKRENIISLSEKGEDILKEMNQILMEWNDMIYAGLSEEEIKYIQRISKVMADNAVNAINKDGGI